MTVRRAVAERFTFPKWTKANLRLSLTWPVLTIGLIGLDGLALVVAFALAYVVRFKTGIPLLETPPHSPVFYSSLTFWAVPVWLGLFALYHLYDREYLFAGFREYVRVVNACTSGVIVVIFISFLDLTLSISRGWLLIVWALSMLCVGGARFVLRRLLRWFRARGALTTPTVIVGANEEGRALLEQFLSDPGSGTRVVGVVDPVAPVGTRILNGLVVLGDLQNLERVIREHGVTEVVVATTAVGHDVLLDLFQRLARTNEVQIRLSSGLYEILTTGVRVQEISSVPLMTPQRIRITGVDAILKAILDYSGAIVGLIALAPVLLIIAILIKHDSAGPVLHRRLVLGRSGHLFDAFKFRTMVANADEVLTADERLRQAFEEGYKLKDDPRVTRIGRFLRRTSLDELPQLINVLRGEMSLVGPRMIAPEEASRYGKWQLNLLTVKPGITGPWQVHGRSDIPYQERVRLSMHYIRNYSIWLDLEILLRTVLTVLRGRGAY